jgi:hypothetical protein
MLFCALGIAPVVPEAAAAAAGRICAFRDVHLYLTRIALSDNVLSYPQGVAPAVLPEQLPQLLDVSAPFRDAYY